MDTAISPNTDHDHRTHADQTDPHARRSQKPAQEVAGWGVDLDRANRPAVPMERTPPRLDNVHWEVPAQQEVRVKIHHSTERPASRVFGTSTPPSGISAGCATWLSATADDLPATG